MKNRKVLLTIIDSKLFCGFQEIALRGHNEMEDSLNPGGFRSLLKFASKLNKDLETHFETSKTFQECLPQYKMKFRYVPWKITFYFFIIFKNI